MWFKFYLYKVYVFINYVWLSTFILFFILFNFINLLLDCFSRLLITSARLSLLNQNHQKIFKGEANMLPETLVTVSIFSSFLE